MRDVIVVYGAGGHAKVVVEAILAATPDRIVALLDDNPESQGKIVLGLEVAGGRKCLEEQFFGLPIALGIGSNSARAALMASLRRSGHRLESVIHPSAIVSPSAALGDGVFIAAGAIVMTEARLGRGVIVNTGASVDHDCVLGEAVHVGPGARLCGNVRVGTKSLIGVGSAVCPGVSIGANVIVGAGSAVTADLASGLRYGGCPARELTQARTSG